jgi:hypothetical protein
MEHAGRRSRATTRTTTVAAIVICAGVFSQCSGGAPGTPPSAPSPTIPGPPTVPSPNPTPPPPIAPQVFSGAGDIARCNEGNAAGVSRLFDTIGGTIFTLGDNAYMNGTSREYRDCYEPTWGRHKYRTYPTPGNHEYGTPGALPYFEYFGTNAGPFGRGYYSYPVGVWHVISLNSEIPTGPGSAQAAWLQSELELNSSTRCTLAYWHKPVVSSGPNGDHPHMRHFFNMLYDAGAEIILNGHDHLYERFAPQDGNGRFDPVLGVRQFTVGTGGVVLYDFLRVSKPNSERQIKAHGILKLTLMADSYLWEFLPVSGSSAEYDSGMGVCH